MTGKRRQPSKGGYRTRDEAVEALNEHLAAVQQGTWADDRNQTVSTWLAKWLEQCERDLEPKTVAGYRSHVVVLNQHLGHLRLRDLQRHHVEAMLRALREPVPPRARGLAGVGRGGRQVTKRSARTLDGYRRTLRAAMSAAMRVPLITQNPAVGRMDALPSIRRANTTWWEPEQVAAFLVATAADQYAALYELAAFAGLRRGELLGLRWSDVDLTSSTPGVTIRQTLSELAGVHPCTVCGGQHTSRRIKASPKGERGDRWVPLVGGTVRELVAHQAAQSMLRDRWGPAYTDHGLVFAQEDGNPLSPGAVTKRFEAITDQIRFAEDATTPDGAATPDEDRKRLPRIRLHDMRHGAASLLIAAGVPIEMVAMILGHAPDVTRRIYAHVLKAPAASGMAAAEALVRGDQRAQSVHSADPSDAFRPRSER